MKKSGGPSRRSFMAGALTPASAAGRCGAQTSSDAPKAAPRIYLDEYQPKSMLVLPQTHVVRARYPVIDVHNHVSLIFGAAPFGAASAQVPPPPDMERSRQRVAQMIPVMDSINLQTMLDLTGGTGDILKRNIAELQKKHEGRFLVCTEPSYTRYADPGYANWQGDELQRAKNDGAVGLKVLKSLGLVLREKITSGPLVKIDDPKFDPMWEAAGALGLPVFIHISDPDAFFTPTDKYNERYEELQHHPDWSFYGKDFPQKSELLAQRNRVIARHPKTTFVCLHIANHPENLDEVTEWLHRYPNMHCEMAARISELGRQPRRSQKFFDAFQDRIMFGTDAHGPGEAMYRTYYRFLETLDEHFDYSGNPIPTQGRWKISGIGLPDQILKKVYHNNAAQLLKLKLV